MVAGIFLAFLVSLVLLFSAGPDKVVTVYRWLEFTNLSVPIEFRIDGLTTMMLSMVTFVSTLVAYLRVELRWRVDPRGYPRFFMPSVSSSFR